MATVLPLRVSRNGADRILVVGDQGDIVALVARRSGARHVRPDPDGTPGIRAARLRATVSHEVKTPLTIVGGFAATLTDDSITPEQRRQFAGSIVTHARRR